MGCFLRVDYVTISATMNRLAGKILASPYASFMRLRRWAYRKGIRKSRAVDAPVICIGNITVGGTGKTPMVAWVVGQLQKAGHRPAILTRGYKAVGGMSDEAELLKRLTGVPVVINPDRVAGAKKAIADGANVLVMDDGFQHLRIRRDLDIVLIDAGIPFGGGVCLPVGRLREPLTALRDAHAIIITRSDTVPAEELNNLRKRLARLAPQASIHTAVHKPVKLIDENGAELPPDTLAGRKVCAFCGIGNPKGFFATLSEAGARIVKTIAFSDHSLYNSSALERISSASTDAEVLITTTKDRIRINNPASFPLPLWTLEVEMRIIEGEQSLVEMILRALQVR